MRFLAKVAQNLSF